MDPLTAAMLISTAGTTAKLLPDIIGTKYERDQKAQLEALKKKEAAGALGLTDEERRLMESRLLGPAQAQSLASTATQKNLLAGSGASSGAALLGAQLAAEEAARARGDVAAKIEEQNYAKKQEQLDQMALLEQAAGIKAAKRVAAAGSILGAGVEAAATVPAQSAFLKISPEQAAGMAAQQKTAGVNNNLMVMQFANANGLTVEQAQKVVDAISSQPELLKYYQLTRGGK